MNTIGVLTSGGDAPGMNAAIRAVVRAAKFHNFRAIGIRRGFGGLLHGDMFELMARDVSDVLQRGGTILQTARSNEFMEEGGVQKAIAQARYYGIEGLVVIGGDGSFKGAQKLAELGLPTIGIPGTIDNDIACTDYTIGFDTAVNTAKDAVDKIRDTAGSHRRCNIIEVMGRNCGDLAIHVAICCGAEAVLIPEMAVDEHPNIIEIVNEGIKRNKRHFIVVVAEGVNRNVNYDLLEKLKNDVETQTGIETKVNTLGYMQRGGSPTAHDRMAASQMGVKAVELLASGASNRIVGRKGGVIYDVNINEGLSQQRSIDHNLIKVSDILSI
jgi:6-phosphofructokinase 1